MAGIKVSRVSIASTMVLSSLLDYRWARTLATVADSTDSDPVKLVEFMAAMIAALEESIDGRTD